MSIIKLALPVALALGAGCGQDLDLGQTHSAVVGSAPFPALERQPPAPDPVASPGCPITDPAELPAPARCHPYPHASASAQANPRVHELCFVTADGRVLPHADEGIGPRRLPDCPTGVFFKMPEAIGDVEKLERAVVVLQGDDNDRRTHLPDSGPRRPRTIEVFPDRGAFFVRLDPRPGNGQRVNVAIRYAELFPGPFASFSAGFITGQPSVR
jgi:hypothetical protein